VNSATLNQPSRRLSACRFLDRAISAFSYVTRAGGPDIFVSRDRHGPDHAIDRQPAKSGRPSSWPKPTGNGSRTDWPVCPANQGTTAHRIGAPPTCGRPADRLGRDRSLNAGTLNPCLPKRVITSTLISLWYEAADRQENRRRCTPTPGGVGEETATGCW
jgi:hypothetical protein